MESEIQGEEAVVQEKVVRTRKSKRLVVDSCDEDSTTASAKPAPKRATNTYERVRLQEERPLKEGEDMRMALERSMVESGPPQVTQSLFCESESKAYET